jgi:predicted aspartyl protease
LGCIRRVYMGTFTVSVQVGDLARREFIEVDDALVDAGTTYSMFPESTLARLRIEQEGYRRFELADNRIVKYPIGYARFRLDGNEAIAIVVFAPEEISPLVGATTLENLSLGVDPVNQRLVPVPALLK